jgi:four helix bundle suffix protein
MPSTSSIASSHAAIAANAALVLLGVATTLLDRQLAAQAQAFETEGGFTERLYHTRQTRRCST